MADNGMDYLTGTFLSACDMFGIDITRSAILTPTDKPNVERAFHTIKTRFVEHLPGNTGGSVDRRGLKPEDDDLLDIHTLAELFDRWEIGRASCRERVQRWGLAGAVERQQRV